MKNGNYYDGIGVSIDNGKIWLYREREMENCFICKKHKGLVGSKGLEIYRDEQVSVYHLDPRDDKIYLGYLFIELNRHASGLEDMLENEACAIGKMLQKLSKVLKENYDIEHIYAYVIGDNIPHLHYHVVPRYKGAPKEFYGVKVDEWKGAPHGNLKQVIDFCKKLKELLA